MWGTFNRMTEDGTSWQRIVVCELARAEKGSSCREGVVEG